MAGRMKVRVIGKANGVGLSRDFELLAAALRSSGCEVTLQGCERRDRKLRRNVFTRLAARARGLRGGGPDAPYDVNLMLEHMWPQFLHQANRNVLVPNPEWFDRRDVAFLGAAQRVWAKTALAERVFAARGCRAVRIGFDSADRHAPAVLRETKFLHLAGRSPLKGTARLHSLWRRHPEWPRLTIVQDAEEVANPTRGGEANIRIESSFLSDAALRTLQNSHRFHLCTSEAEGWGHYIAEAMSVGAVTLTCDAPPMNELITPARGVLLDVHSGERQNLVTLSLFDEAALEAAVTRVLGMSSTAWETMGAAARAWFLDNKRGFFGRVRQALEELQT
jgi:glycosyltransferase involved in cell wall biosynthesis